MKTGAAQARKTRIQDFLSQLPLFRELGSAELGRLAAGTTGIKVARGETVFSRGEPCVGMHAVVYGQVRLLLVSPAGTEKVVRIVGPGASFGEAVMFLGKPYVVSCQALADTFLLHVGKNAIMEEIRARPEFACKMLASLSQRLHGLMADVEAYSLRSGTERVAAYLLRESGNGRINACTLPASKTVIASRLNLTPEHFSRILHDLGDRGLIVVRGREIDIVDPAGLACAPG